MSVFVAVLAVSLRNSASVIHLGKEDGIVTILASCCLLGFRSAGLGQRSGLRSRSIHLSAIATRNDTRISPDQQHERLFLGGLCLAGSH